MEPKTSVVVEVDRERSWVFAVATKHRAETQVAEVGTSSTSCSVVCLGSKAAAAYDLLAAGSCSVPRTALLDSLMLLPQLARCQSQRQVGAVSSHGVQLVQVQSAQQDCMVLAQAMSLECQYLTVLDSKILILVPE